MGKKTLRGRVLGILVAGGVALMMGLGIAIAAHTFYGNTTSHAETIIPKQPSERPEYLHVKDTQLGPLWLNHIESVEAINRASKDDPQARLQMMKQYAASPIENGELQVVLGEATKALNADGPDYETFRIAMTLAGSRKPMTDNADLVQLASSFLTMRPSNDAGLKSLEAYLSALRYLSESPTNGLLVVLEACDPKFWLNQGFAIRGMTGEQVAYRMAGAAVWVAVDNGEVDEVAKTVKELRDVYQGDVQAIDASVGSQLAQLQYQRYQLILAQGEKNLQRRAAGQDTEWDLGDVKGIK